MGFKIDGVNLDNEEILEKLKNVLFKSALKMHALAIQNAPSGVTDELRQEIELFPKTWGESSYLITSWAGHSAAIEFGTKPHKVSPMHLKDWARIKLGDENAAFPIAKKIAKVGTDAHPFMYPAYLEVREIHIRDFFKKEFR